MIYYHEFVSHVWTMHTVCNLLFDMLIDDPRKMICPSQAHPRLGMMLSLTMFDPYSHQPQAQHPKSLAGGSTALGFGAGPHRGPHQ